MSEMQGKQRSAVVFGARNLGRAVIELLVSDGWAVTGVARSRSTLDGISAAGALALEADVTDPASVHSALEQAAAAHGGVDLALNAAAAYGGERTGPFGGGSIAEADLDGFDTWAWRRPVRPSRSCPRADDSRSRRTGRRLLVQVTGGSGRRALPGRVAALHKQDGEPMRLTRTVCPARAVTGTRSANPDGKDWPEPAYSRLSVEDRFCGAPVARINVIR